MSLPILKYVSEITLEKIFHVLKGVRLSIVSIVADTKFEFFVSKFGNEKEMLPFTFNV